MPALVLAREDIQRIRQRLVVDGVFAPPRGRHAAPRQRWWLTSSQGVLRGSRFMMFSLIGGFVFVLGLVVQYWLTGRLHLLAEASYFAQAVVSIEASFVLNRWLTWRDRDTPFWRAFVRFNLQKTVTVALNLALYEALLRLGMDYLVANIVLTAVFTVVNYLAGDRFVFVPTKTPRRAGVRSPAANVGPHPTLTQFTSSPIATLDTPVLDAVTLPDLVAEKLVSPRVSVVIPCRNNEGTIGPTVQSLLDQDYPGLYEIVLIGSPEDRTWAGLSGIGDSRVVTRELETPPGMRDANFKRNAGVNSATGDLIALVDSDIVLPRDWMTKAVEALQESGASCVTGGMRSIHDTFWGRYTDNTRIGAKTPRVANSYAVTSADFGAHGRKPPISANILFTPELYAACPIDPMWSHGSYEDYEWFWRVVRAGHPVLVCEDLFGWHHHRRGLKALVREYLRSSRGCAYFIKAHIDSPFAKRRLSQALCLPLAAMAGVIATAGALVAGETDTLATLAAVAVAVVLADQLTRTRRLESIAYPAVGVTLGVVFTAGLLTNLVRSRAVATDSPFVGEAIGVPGTSSDALAPTESARNLSGPIGENNDRPARRGLRLLTHPLTSIGLLQVILSTSLVWTNTAFTDEADYLWIGRLVLSHWLHHTSWPSNYGDKILPGAPVLYPPLGALANDLGGLAGVRVLSMLFMLGATVLLYFTAVRLIGRRAAIFGVAVWAFTEPVLRLAFATPDAMSTLLIALSAFLCVRAGHRRRHGELIASAAAVLALANVSAYHSLSMAAVVVIFALLTWSSRLGWRQAACSTAWLVAAWVLALTVSLTVARSWSAFSYTNFGHGSPDNQPYSLVVSDSWQFAGLLLILTLVGVATAIHSANKGHAAVLIFLGCLAFVVPTMQLADHSIASLDINLARYSWFAAICAGYGCDNLVSKLVGVRRQIAVASAILALCYPVATGYQAAWEQFHGWPDSSIFIKSLRPIVSETHGLIYVSREEHVSEYYLSGSSDWRKWYLSGTLLKSGRAESVRYYAAALRAAPYGVIALFYSTTLSSRALPSDLLLSTDSTGAAQRKFLRLVSANSGLPGLSALTIALEEDPAYRLVAAGPHDTAHGNGDFAIWRKVTRR